MSLAQASPVKNGSNNFTLICHLHSRYDLMIGVVRSEAYFALTADDAQYGIEADRRTKILREFVRNTYTYHQAEILATIINEYTDWERPVQHPVNIKWAQRLNYVFSRKQFLANFKYSCKTQLDLSRSVRIFILLVSQTPIFVPRLNGSIFSFLCSRDETLEALGDANTVAPATRTADLHSQSHRNSYLYVFDYQTKFGDYPQVRLQRFSFANKTCKRVKKFLDLNGNRDRRAKWSIMQSGRQSLTHISYILLLTMIHYAISSHIHRASSFIQI